MSRSRSKSRSKPQESFFEESPVEKPVEPVKAEAVEVKQVEVKREPSPQEVFSSILEKLQSREQLLVLRGEELYDGRVNTPTVFSGEVEVVAIDIRHYYRTGQGERDIVVVVRPLSEKALVKYRGQMYIYIDKKWETLE
jgi:alkanesulfonate monooxygenase SsuD/methylene tetrahydromethanopterin reductase-like flavin-dependent oxidoreductase (luciferase family)